MAEIEALLRVLRVLSVHARVDKSVSTVALASKLRRRGVGSSMLPLFVSQSLPHPSRQRITQRGVLVTNVSPAANERPRVRRGSVRSPDRMRLGRWRARSSSRSRAIGGLRAPKRAGSGPQATGPGATAITTGCRALGSQRRSRDIFGLLDIGAAMAAHLYGMKVTGACKSVSMAA